MIAAVLVTLAFLTFSALLAGDLRRQASRDTLGLKAARAEVVADIHRRVYRARREDRLAHAATKAEQFAQVFGVRALARVHARVVEDGRQRLQEFHAEDR